MRVITGFARGCRLKTPPGKDTRPTADRVKEGLFSTLQFELEGRLVLDLFAGSGQLGIEAISRGAAGCVFVDSSPVAAETIRANLAAVRAFAPSAAVERRTHIMAMDAVGYLTRTADKFDIALLDPPYAADLLPEILRLLAPRMNPGGVIVCETDKGTALPDAAGAFRPARSRRYGRTTLHIWRALPSQQEAAL